MDCTDRNLNEPLQIDYAEIHALYTYPMCVGRNSYKRCQDQVNEDN